jgi:hypothetical protein
MERLCPGTTIFFPSTFLVWGFTGTIFFPSPVFATVIAFEPLHQLGGVTTYRENKKTLTFGFSHPLLR